MLNKLTIANKLYGGFGIVTVLVVFLVLFSWTNLNTLHDLEEEVAYRGNDAVIVQEGMGMAAQAYSVLADAIINRDLEQNAVEWNEIITEMRDDLKLIETLVDHPDEVKWINQAKEMAEEYNEDYHNMVRLIKAGDDAGIKEADEEIDEMKTEFEAIMSNLAEALVNEKTEADEKFSSTSNRIIATNLVLGLIVLGISVFFAIFLTRMIVKSLTLVIAMLKEIAQGDADLSKRLDIDSQDEIGELGKWFDTFMGILEKDAENQKEIQKGVMASSEDLAVTSTKLNSISDDISNRSTTIAEQSNLVSAATEQLSTNMIDISSNSEQAQNNLNSVASSTEEMTSAISEVAGSAEKAREVTSDAVRNVASASARVDELGVAANEITKVIGTIVEIAEQTKLLALNATIEAARAGEAGKGFAVVANEVKDLATQTNVATEDIRQKVEAIQSSSNNTSTEIKNIDEVMKQVNEIVNTIATAVEEQNVTSQDIARNIGQATDGVSIVVKNVSQAAQVSKEVAGNIANVNTEINNINNVTNDMKTSSNEVDEATTNLKSMASRFQV